MLEENETQETSLKDLIDLVERDDLPTNEFTIEDKDPMVILGKLNEVIAYLQTLQDTINSSDSKANEALQKAIQALANAVEAVSTANTALSASNTALSTANTAINTANTAIDSANSAVDTASRAENKADIAITTANEAKGTAEGIDDKATTALENSQTAISTANTANSKAQEALDQVVANLDTKVYRDTTFLPTLDIKPIEEQITTNTADIAQALGEIAELDADKVDKVAGKQLSTEDFTTALLNKLNGLYNYDDTQVQADLSSLSSNKADKNNSNQSIVAGSVTADTGTFTNINNRLSVIGITMIYNTTTSASGTYSFTDNISNYELLVFIAYDTSHNEYHSYIIPVAEFKYSNACNINGNTKDTNYNLTFNYVSNTSFKITGRISMNLRRVYGVKL